MAPWMGEESGPPTISRIHLTRGEGAHDKLTAGDSLALEQCRLTLNRWLSIGWAKAGTTEATVSRTLFGTFRREKSVIVLVCALGSGGDGGF